MNTYTKREQILSSIIIVLAGLLIFSHIMQTKSGLSPAAYDVDQENYKWSIGEFATNLDVPWDMSFTSDGRLFITERPGHLKIRLTNGEIDTVTGAPNVASVGESGLTGLALHPDFDKNSYLYLYYTYRDAGEIFNRVSRFTFKDTALLDEKIIFDKLPGGSIHNGGRLRFGPDGKLWVPTGDGGHPALAQDKNSLGGKILRANDDGTLPQDNPNAGSFVYSLGHRNPQGLAWHPLTEELIDTEHGETAHDEINLIKPNGNYGWSEVKKCTSTNTKFTSPILCSGETTWAPSGIAAMGTTMWRYRYSFVFAGLRGNLLKRIAVMDGKVTEREDIIKGTYGRLRAVTVDKDGNIYVSTSNKDGRGQPKPNDDKILKLTPKKI